MAGEHWIFAFGFPGMGENDGGDDSRERAVVGGGEWEVKGSGVLERLGLEEFRITGHRWVVPAATSRWLRPVSAELGRVVPRRVLFRMWGHVNGNRTHRW